MLKVLVGLMFFMGGGLVGGKFYTEYKIEESLDKIIQMAGAAADISYGDATINFDGSFSLTNLRISQAGSADEIRIGEMTFNSSSNWIFLAQVHKTADEKLKAWVEDQPEKISFKVDNMSFAPDQVGMENSSVVMSGCGNINESGSDALMELGFERVNVDFDVNVDTSNKSESVIEFLTKVDEIGDVEILYNMDFSNFNVASLGAGEMPELTSIAFSLLPNQHFATNSVNFCAKQMNMSVEEYLATVVGDPAYMKGSGVIPDQQMMDAVVALAQGARLDIKLQPSISFADFGQLKFYKPKDVMQLLGLSVEVDGKALDNIVLDPDGFQVAEATWADKDFAVTKEDAAKPVKVGYHKVTRDQLSGLVGYHIKVTRKSAEPMVGKLLSTSSGTVNIQQRRYGGSVTFPIDNKDIASLEAYY